MSLVLQVGVDPAATAPLEAPAERAVTFDRPLLIGRDVGREDIRVDDPYVSRRHAEILWVGTEWAVRDLRSTNGTRVNGVALGAAEARPLKPDDQIQIGSCTLLTVGVVLRSVETGQPGRTAMRPGTV